MTTTFAEYASQQEARNNIALAVLSHTYALCETLRQNYIQSAINRHKYFVEKGENAHHHIASIEKLRQGISSVDFIVETGRKYHKIIFVDGDRSSHAFVDKKTGQVYKSASWKAPAKGVRFDLRLIADREWLLENADWSGHYLYAR